MTWKPILNPITYKDVASSTPPGSFTWISPKFSADEEHLYYLATTSESSELSLYCLDLSDLSVRRLEMPQRANTTSGVTLEEDLRRQRLRISFFGVAGYELFSLAGRELMLINTDGHYLVMDPKRLEIVLDLSDLALTNPTHVPSTTKIAAIEENCLVTIDLLTKEREVVASPSRQGVSVGVAEYVAQEELDRADGYWPSPDGRWIAYTEVDETVVPTFPIVRIDETSVNLEQYRYPFAGEDNASVSLFICGIEGDKLRQIEFPTGYEYLSLAKWLSVDRLLLQFLDRPQRRQRVVIYNPAEDKTYELLSEEIDPWINATPQYEILHDGSVLTTTEASGRRHLCLIVDGSAVPLTEGDFDVNEIVSLSHEHRYVVVTTNYLSPLENSLQIYDLRERRLSEPLDLVRGSRQVVVSKGQRWLLEQHNNREQPFETRLYLLDEPIICGKDHLSATKTWHSHTPLTLKPPRLIEVPLSGGEVMYGLLYLPPDGISKNRPVVVNVYGGPHFQMVRESWSQTADLQAQLLAQNGVVVVKFDNRGSAGRGKSFEAPIYRAMGTVELDDQITGLSYIHSNFDTDESSVGVYGWSYGGFMTLSLLAKRSSTFKVGVAGAPVVDFRWYDNAYTERYMGTPSDNPEGYSHASILSHIEQLKAPCLIIHGLIDENVHFRNTAALLERAMQYDTELELMALPTSRHAPTLQSTRLSIVKRRTEFLLDHLL